MSAFTYDCATDFFSKIETAERAYFLGWLTADGCVCETTRGRKALQVAISPADIDILWKFLDAIRAPRSLVHVYRHSGGKYSSARFHIYRYQLVDDLKRLGVVSRKSLICVPWDGPAKLLSHYYRGIFDGDGSLSKESKKKGRNYTQWLFALCGSRLMMEGAANFLCATTGRQYTLHQKGSIWRIHCAGLASVQSILRAIYQDATAAMWLDRKKSRADECLAQPVCGHVTWTGRLKG